MCPLTHTYRSELPTAIDSEVALTSFRSLRKELMDQISYCFISITLSLYAKFLIPKDVYDEINEDGIRKAQKTLTLLDSIEMRIKNKPSDFVEIVDVLKSEPYIANLADRLIETYKEHAAGMYSF